MRTIWRLLSELEDVLHSDHFTTLIKTALGTYPMRHLRLVTLRADRQRLRFQEVVGPPAACSRLRMASFRIWHGSLLNFLVSLQSLRECPATLPTARRPSTPGTSTTRGCDSPRIAGRGRD